LYFKLFVEIKFILKVHYDTLGCSNSAVLNLLLITLLTNIGLILA